MTIARRSFPVLLLALAVTPWAIAQQPDLDVPYVPTPPEVVDAMLKLADVKTGDVVYDLGCGDGRVVVTAAKEKGARGVGIDIDQERINEATENAEKAGVADRVEFRRQDLFKADIHEVPPAGFVQSRHSRGHGGRALPVAEHQPEITAKAMARPEARYSHRFSQFRHGRLEAGKADRSQRRSNLLLDSSCEEVSLNMPKPMPADTWNNLFYPPPDYQYFEDSDQFAFESSADGFSWRNAWWLAEAALLSYVKDWDFAKGVLTRAGFSDAEAIGPSAAKSTKGFFASRSGPAPFAIAAFRGTDRDDVRNAATDADAVPIERDGYTVHRGFATALDQVWDDEVKPLLAQFLTSDPGAPVYFTGHSLGAALATLGVARYTGKCGLYTIGSPRVGDDRFARVVLQKTQSVFRFVNGQDVVTQVPPEIPLQHYYRHVGLEKYIDRNGTILDNPSELDKGFDVIQGIIAHDGAAALNSVGHPGVYLSRLLQTLPLVDPPPHIVGNHSPSRYPIHIWNHYSRL
jgi:triacylglycerol lipase